MTENEGRDPIASGSARAVSSSSAEVAGPEATTAETDPVSRPDSIPERFWDDEAGYVRTDALIESYLEMERTVGEVRADVPDSAEDYHIASEHELFESDPEINKQLHAAGFNRNQAQLVYTLAAQHLLPMVAEVAAEFEAEKEIAQLRDEFGGEDQWREAARQIGAWGRSNLPGEVFDTLAASRAGVLAMRKMMAAEEPKLLADGVPARGPLSEADLKHMMRDPRYWREQDAEFIGKVSEGFRRIYDE